MPKTGTTHGVAKSMNTMTGMICCEMIHYWVEFILVAAICVVLYAVPMFLCVVLIAAAALLCFALVAIPVVSCVIGKRKITKRSTLQMVRCDDGTRKLLEDFTLTIGNLCPITVHKDFVTDFSSLPPGLRWTMHWSRVDVAGVVHDWLYYQNVKTPGMTRLKADWIWCDIAVNGNRHANLIQAAAGWLGLRIYGWKVWRGYQRNEEN